MIQSFFANSYDALPMFSGFSFAFISIWLILLFAWIILSVVLKGYALWNAAKRDETAWFVVLLLVNTMGILELVYLYFIVKKWNSKKTDSNPSSTPSSTPTSPSVQ